MSTFTAKSRTEIYEAIADASPPTQEKIREEIAEIMPKNVRLPAQKTTTANNGHDTGPPPPLTTQERLSRDVSNLDENPFMRAPSKQVLDRAIGDFIDRTGNSALASGICAVCAREINEKELTLHRLDHIPSPLRLRPEVSHPAHDIYNGMLLHPRGVFSQDSANVCTECVRALTADKTPALALANGMWIGAVPHELAYLTLPERLLIAKYFPAAYIIKLYPKKKGARHWDKRQMYSGLKGNVSTYQLDQGQIESMIDGSILPQQPKVLAATIGITFVGPKNLPDRYLPDMFRVRRSRVQRALEWLKDNNPLFSNITISASRLEDLPEDDIPFELLATTKLSTDVEKLYAEHEGYVPTQDGCEEEGTEGKVYSSNV
jgi:hypothetical protein